MHKIRHCPDCKQYTMLHECPRCKRATIIAKPLKYSPEDKYGKYRRQAKQAQDDDAE